MIKSIIMKVIASNTVNKTLQHKFHVWASTRIHNKQTQVTPPPLPPNHTKLTPQPQPPPPALPLSHGRVPAPRLPRLPLALLDPPHPPIPLPKHSGIHAAYYRLHSATLAGEAQAACWWRESANFGRCCQKVLVDLVVRWG